MIVAPVNPADINTIQGVYPVKPPLPATGGFEGIGDVLAVGSCVKNLCPGDRVIADGAMGTWCTAGVFDSKLLRKVSNIELYLKYVQFQLVCNVIKIIIFRMISNTSSFFI